MAEVEILLGTRNGARHLGPQLASYAAQSAQDWSLLVSDDGSRDETRAILRRFGRARPGAGLRLIDGPGRGAAANYLHLLSNADMGARAIALSDQDDVWFPQKLSRGLHALRSRPRSRPVLYAACTIPVDAWGRPVLHPATGHAAPSFANALVQNVAAGNTIMLNRAAVSLARQLTPGTVPPFHDWWFYALMTGIGAEVILDPQPVLAYRQHAGAMIGANRSWRARIRRASLIADGSWKSWLTAHHEALASVASAFPPDHRALLATLRNPGPGRMRALVSARARRQGLSGQAVLCLAALCGLA